jgi:tRNA(fMet)-specific endonuclease VapC
MILLDTCIIIEYLKRNPEVIKEIDKITFGNICINDIILMELYKGAKNKSDLKFISNELKNIAILDINQPIIGLAKNIIEKYSLSHNIHIVDAVIAASALIYNIEIYTYNKKDFYYIPDLKLYLP